MALPPSLLLKRGAARRCPVCGSGRLFRRWVRMVPTCPGCGLRFRRSPGQWLGSWFLNICLVQTVVVALLVLVVGTSWPEAPSGLELAVVLVAAVAVPVAFFPWSRTLWTAIDLAMRPLELDDGVAPGVELDQIARLPPPRGHHRHRHRRPPSGTVPTVRPGSRPPTGPRRSPGAGGRRPPTSG